MYPILTRYDSIFIYSFTVVLAVGVLAAGGLTVGLSRKKPADGWFDALLAVFVAAIIGGRLGFVFGQWVYFQEHPNEIWQIGLGGLSYYGALFAGLTALLLWTRYFGRSFYDYAALFSPGFALLLSFGWLACWFEGCAYGRETMIGPFSADLADEYGVFALRYQTQLIGLLLSFAAFMVILWLYKRLKPPVLFWSALFLISAAHLVPDLLRGDPAMMFGALRLDSLLDGILIANSLLMLQYYVRKG
ncbi:MAG: prolipoprotein diacylglyceryl transferase [Candidatus Promineifilaceae bacterium]|jgi:phosphatidylglycerol---prolipoprotein diacylglyceryl transferase